MPAAKQHFAYADALINASIKEYTKNGDKAKKSAAIAAAKGAEGPSYNASYAEDKKRRPKNPKTDWATTSRSINKNIQDAAWKGVQTAYRKVKREKSDLILPGEDNGISYAILLGAGAAGKGAALQFNRRNLIIGAGVTMTSMLALGTGEANAANWGYIREVMRDINPYIASKKAAIEDALRRGL